LQGDQLFRECLDQIFEVMTQVSAQTGANTAAMTALSELVLANFSAVFRLMKPKPYESSTIPTTTQDYRAKAAEM
jgi:hypothetical protein